MPYPLTDVSLTLNTQSVPNIQGLNLGGVAWIVFQNASPFALRVSLGGAIHIIPAWYYYPVPTGGQALSQITVMPYLQTIPGAGFTANLSTVLYLIGEAPPSTFAQTLGGGPVDLTIATSVVNTGNPPATQVVYAQTASDTGTNATSLQIFNDGTIALGDVNNPAPKIELFGNAGGAVHIGTDYIGGPVPIILNNNVALESNDNLNSPHVILKAASNNNVLIQALAGLGNIQLLDKNGATQETIDTTGVTFAQAILASGGINANTVRDNVNGNTALDLSAGTGAVTFPHGLTVNGDSISINGSTSGTATLYQIFRGAYKYVLVQMSNFRNGGGSTQTIGLPVGFTSISYIRSSDANTFQLLHLGSAITVGIITALALGGGTVSNATSIGSYSFAQGGSWETLSFNSGAASAHNGVIIIEGV